MKYVKPGVFTTEQLSIEETITEIEDVVQIAKDVIKKITDVSDDVKKELTLAMDNLGQAIDYLDHIRRKTDTALTFVPQEIQEKHYL